LRCNRNNCTREDRAPGNASERPLGPVEAFAIRSASPPDLTTRFQVISFSHSNPSLCSTFTPSITTCVLHRSDATVLSGWSVKFTPRKYAGSCRTYLNLLERAKPKLPPRPKCRRRDLNLTD